MKNKKIDSKSVFFGKGNRSKTEKGEKKSQTNNRTDYEFVDGTNGSRDRTRIKRSRDVL